VGECLFRIIDTASSTVAGFVYPYHRAGNIYDERMEKADPYGEWVLRRTQRETAGNPDPLPEEVLTAARAAGPRVVVYRPRLPEVCRPLPLASLIVDDQRQIGRMLQLSTRCRHYYRVGRRTQWWLVPTGASCASCQTHYRSQTEYSQQDDRQ